jgi:hypothetical protein
MNQQQYEAILGEPDAGFFKMSEEQVRRYFIARPIGSSVTHVKEMRQQQAQAMMGILQTVTPVMQASAEPFTIDWYQAAKTGMDALDIKNTDQILVKLQPQQIQQMQAQQMQMQQKGMADQLKQVAYGEEIKQGTAAKYKIMTDNNAAQNTVMVEAAKARINPKPVGGNAHTGGNK